MRIKLTRNPLHLIVVFCLAVTLILPGPAAGITIQEEEKLAREFLKVVFEHYEQVKDPLIVNYVRRVGMKIAAVLPPQPFGFNFYVLNNAEYNAFASPGGYIFINSGLIGAMDNEDELAGILGHEMAHVACRHISDKIERNKKIGLATLAGVVAGIFLGLGGAGTAAQALTYGSVAAGQSLELSYSREDEMQADQLGLDYLLKAGYSGAGLIRMLNKIRSKQWYGKDQIPTYLRTHPASEDRMAYLGAWLEKHPAPAKKAADTGFLKIHTRLVALYGDPELAAQAFGRKIEHNPSDWLAQYGYGLLMTRGGHRQEAIAAFTKALNHNAFDADILTELGKAYYLDGQLQRGLSILEGAVSIDPLNPDAYFYLGRMQLDSGYLQEAAATFNKLLEKDPQYTEGYYFLGETYGKRKQMAQAHYYLGLYYQQKGDPRKATFHFQRAKDQTEDPQMREKIEAALEALRKESGEKEKPKS